MVGEPTPAGSRRPVRCRPGSSSRLLISRPILAQFPDLRIVWRCKPIDSNRLWHDGQLGTPPNSTRLGPTGRVRRASASGSAGPWRACFPAFLAPGMVRTRRSTDAGPCSCSTPRTRSACSPGPRSSGRPSGDSAEERVPVGEVPVDRRLADLDRLVIAVLDDGPRHPAEDRLDDFEELRAGGERGQLDQGGTVLGPVFGRVDLLDSPVQGLRRVPRRRVPAPESSGCAGPGPPARWHGSRPRRLDRRADAPGRPLRGDQREGRPNRPPARRRRQRVV